jgi:hypothetical protein
MRLLSILLCIALTGCVTQTQVPLPNGETGWYIKDCSDLSDCYKRAAELCSGKYEIIGESQDTHGTPMPHGGTVIGTSHGLTIRCPPPSEGSPPKGS